MSVNNRKLCGEAKLLLALYNAESMNIETNINLKYFKDAVDCYRENERSFVHLAQYMDRVFASLSDEDNNREKGTDLLLEIMEYYGKSMVYGCQFLYQLMSRMLSVEKFIVELPLFPFFTAFSQIVSRICHPSNVYALIKTILVKLIIHFPQQSLWMISSVFKSSYPNRVKRCTEVFKDRRLSEPKIQTLNTDFNSLVKN